MLQRYRGAGPRHRCGLQEGRSHDQEMSRTEGATTGTGGDQRPIRRSDAPPMECPHVGRFGTEGRFKDPCCVRGSGCRVARRRIGDVVGTGPGYRVLLVLLMVASAYVLARAVTADEPSTVSIVIRAIGLVACSFSLAESFIKGRRRSVP